MAETVTIGDTEVEINETADGFEAVEVEEDFEDYLRENVFTSGCYETESSSRYGNLGIAEWVEDDEFASEGSGHIVRSDMERALDDENVRVVTVTDGVLYLADER